MAWYGRIPSLVDWSTRENRRQGKSNVPADDEEGHNPEDKTIYQYNAENTDVGYKH